MLVRALHLPILADVVSGEASAHTIMMNVHVHAAVRVLGGLLHEAVADILFPTLLMRAVVFHLRRLLVVLFPLGEWRPKFRQHWVADSLLVPTYYEIAGSS
jgi:hypothetical protein